MQKLYAKALSTLCVGLTALSVMLSNTTLNAGDKPHAGSLDTSFNKGGPKPGLVVSNLSPFLNLAEGVGLQKDDDKHDSKQDSKHNSKHHGKYKIVVVGDAVIQPNPYEPFTGWYSGCDGNTYDTLNDCACTLFADTPACVVACEGTDTCEGVCLECDPICTFGNGIDGFVDERGVALIRYNHDGSVDRSFGENNNGKVFLQIAGAFAGTEAGNLVIDHHNKIIFPGSFATAAGASYGTYSCGGGEGCCESDVPAGQIALCNPSDCSDVLTPSCNGPDCGLALQLDPITGNPFGQSQATVVRLTKNGAFDSSFGVNGVFTLPLVAGSESLGDAFEYAALDKHDNIIAVGFSGSLYTKGCFYGFPIIAKVHGGKSADAGTLDTSFGAGNGYVVEGTITGTGVADTSSFTDMTLSPSQNLGFAEYDACAIHNNGGKLQGYIVCVGEGDCTGVQVPNTARIIAARYQPNGELDTTFGVAGTLVISLQNSATPKQLLARSVVIDEHDNIYLGGDIADNNSGFPGAVSTSLTAPTVLLARPSANFLLIKLDNHGKPKNYGPELTGCNASGCQSSTFESCNSCVLQWYNGTEIKFFRAVSTDFYGNDDAIFALHIDHKNHTITAAGQCAEDTALQSERIAFARYHLESGELDKSFGSGGLVTVDGGRNRRSLVRAMVADPKGKLIAAGQSGFSDEEVTITNYGDSTLTDFATVRINP